MKPVLEIVAAAIAVLVSVLAVFMISAANIYLGIAIGLFLAICGLIAFRQRRKHPHIPFSSPGFLATFGLALGLLSPAFQDLDIVFLIIAALMILLSLLILVATLVTEHKHKQKSDQQPVGGAESPVQQPEL